MHNGHPTSTTLVKKKKSRSHVTRSYPDLYPCIIVNNKAILGIADQIIRPRSEIAHQLVLLTTRAGLFDFMKKPSPL